ncbi:type IV pilus modification protein PilV [Collimonas pratensis]|uniref:type IV pilus modification protein PilV n=1 Tax=Collimonas pratensis TaxID=279113 RepID=UPI00143DF7CC|nr:type IV pilus modification protein PilV [Collimonas pratensis]NKI72649.1 type IV pilus modification protein PilV [Collimonas pratensis]
MAFLSNDMLRAARRQRGVGMIEVLISVTISAFALLGLAGLQMAALKYQKVAHFRSQASQFGADMADRIRANASPVTRAVSSGTSGSSDTATYYRADDQYSTASPLTVPSCAAKAPAACATPQDIADKDIYEWRLALNRGLAGGWGNVSAYDAKQGVTITVYYNEPDKALTKAADANCDASVFPSTVGQNEIRCFQTTVMP